MAPTAATRFTDSMPCSPANGASPSRSVTSTRPATMVRCRPETESTCARPATAMVSARLVRHRALVAGDQRSCNAGRRLRQLGVDPLRNTAPDACR